MLGDLTTDIAIPATVTAAAETFEEWVVDNWIWIVLIVGAVIVVPPLLKKI